jgi:hypothetical protein
LLKNTKDLSSLIIPLAISSDNNPIQINAQDMISFEHQIIDAKLKLNYDIPKLASIVNLILDKNE